MKSILLLIAMIGNSSLALAAGGAHGDAHTIPWLSIIGQLVNVAIIGFLLIKFGKKPITEFFANKKAHFVAAAARSQEARKQAESDRQAVQRKLASLESSATESISRAKAEAADMKKQLVEEANNLSKRLKTEAEQSAKNEVEKAKNSLREEVIKASIDAARASLTSDVSREDHARLQGDFVNNMQAVGK